MTINEYREHLSAFFRSRAKDEFNKAKKAPTIKAKEILLASADAWKNAAWYAENIQPE